MKLGQPLLTTEMSGKLGGLVAAKARGGVLYARARVRPSNPRSQFQTAIRNILSSLAANWRTTLTDLQRASWEALAGGGPISGEALYVGHGANVLLGADTAGGTFSDFATAPASAATELTPPVNVGYDVSAHQIQFGINTADPWNGTDVGGLLVYASSPQKSSRLSRQFPYRLVSSVDNEATSPVNLDAPTSHPVRSAQTGDIIYVKIIAYTIDGRASIAQEFRTVAVA